MWSFQEGSSVPLQSTDSVKVDNDRGQVLFQPLYEANKGKYTCKAINDVGQATADGTVTVRGLYWSRFYYSFIMFYLVYYDHVFFISKSSSHFVFRLRLFCIFRYRLIFIALCYCSFILCIWWCIIIVFLFLVFMANFFCPLCSVLMLHTRLLCANKNFLFTYLWLKHVSSLSCFYEKLTNATYNKVKKSVIHDFTVRITQVKLMRHSN